MNLILEKIKSDPLKAIMFLWIFILPWDFFNGVMGVFTIIFIILWLILGKSKGYFSKLKEIFSNKPIIILILFIMFAYLSLMWSDNQKTAFSELNFYKYYWVLIPIIYTVFDKEDIKTAFYTLVLSFGIYAIFTLSIFLGFFEIGNSNSLNPKGILHYAVVTVYMAINTMFAFYFYLKEQDNQKIKYLFLIISILSFLSLLVNNGRIAQISFLGTLFILIIYYRQYLFQYKKLFISLSLVFFLAISFLYSTNKLDRYAKGFNELVYSYENKEFIGSWGPRLFMWYVAKDTIPKNLLFGAGVGDIRDDIIKYVESNPNQLKHHIIGYHNQHLDYLAKFGLFGYLLFLAGIFILLKELYLNDKYFFILGLIFFSIVLIDSMGDIILLMKPFNNIYVLVFVLLAILVNSKNKQEKIG